MKLKIIPEDTDVVVDVYISTGRNNIIVKVATKLDEIFIDSVAIRFDKVENPNDLFQIKGFVSNYINFLENLKFNSKNKENLTEMEKVESKIIKRKINNFYNKLTDENKLRLEIGE